MLPDGSVKEKTKCNGIDQRNMKFTNPLTGAETTKMTYDIFEHMYISSLPNVDIKTLFKEECKFLMPDRLTKVNYKRTKEQKQNGTDMFTIHSTKIEKVLFSNIWKGRYLYSDHCTVPNNSVYCK